MHFVPSLLANAARGPDQIIIWHKAGWQAAKGYLGQDDVLREGNN